MGFGALINISNVKLEQKLRVTCDCLFTVQCFIFVPDLFVFSQVETCDMVNSNT